jgi:hypothetical protein
VIKIRININNLEKPYLEMYYTKQVQLLLQLNLMQGKYIDCYPSKNKGTYYFQNIRW